MLKKNMFLLTIMITVVFSQDHYTKQDDMARLAPRLLNYQGYLTDDQGIPITNPAMSMTFAIYDAVSSGNQKWTETQTSVSVDKGVFSVLLGSVTSIPDTVFTAGTDRWLELVVGGQTLTPRTRIVSSAYAYTSTYSDTALYALNAAADNDWAISGNKLYPVGDYGIFMRSSNTAIGTEDSTHVSLGIASITGFPNQNFKYCTVGGGYLNKSRGTASTIAGGYNNHCSSTGNGATIGGGYNNNAGHEYATVAGGSGNYVSQAYGTIGGGYSNQASGHSSSISGGYTNRASNQGATVGGGMNNRARGQYSVVSGGGAPNEADSNSAIGNYSAIGGGIRNRANGAYATVSGGFNNVANGYVGTVAGGSTNAASGYVATIGGGSENIASGFLTTVAGGCLNTASDTNAIVGGGYYNYAGGKYSAILGGYADTIFAGADYSYLFGINSNLTQDSTFMVDMPHIRFGTEAAGYEFPVTDGSSGQALVTDGSGQVSWGSTGDNDWVINGSNMYSGVSGNVGIGVTDPTHPLHVEGSVSMLGSAVGHFVNTETMNDGVGVYGACFGVDANGWGGWFKGGQIGVRGTVGPTGNSNYYGVEAVCDGNSGTGTNHAVYARCEGAGTNYGIYAYAHGTGNNYAVYGFAENGSSNWAGYFNGNAYVNSNMAVRVSSPTSALDIEGANGYSQFRMRKTYTPSGTSDTNGNTGDIAWDDTYIYIKTSAGWKRSVLASW